MRPLKLAARETIAASLAFEQEAFAGACTMCASHADCDALMPGGLCVIWDRDFGCGAQRQSCCPGQNCALDNGAPSCLGNGCTLVGGPIDAGPAPIDSGGGSPVDSGDRSPLDTGPAVSPFDASGPADSSGASDRGPVTSSPIGRDGSREKGYLECRCVAFDGASPLPWAVFVAFIALASLCRRGC